MSSSHAPVWKVALVLLERDRGDSCSQRGVNGIVESGRVVEISESNSLCLRRWRILLVPPLLAEVCDSGWGRGRGGDDGLRYEVGLGRMPWSVGGVRVVQGLVVVRGERVPCCGGLGLDDGGGSGG